MKISNSRIPHVFIFLITWNFFCELNCYNPNELDFEREAILPSVSLGELHIVIVFIEPEDRQKLCFYAAVKAKLPYIDYKYVPEWRKYLPPEGYYRCPYQRVLHCQGVPDFYLLRRGREPYKIQITFLESAADRYQIESKEITVKSVKQRDDLQEKFRGTDAAKMDIEARKAICARSSKHTDRTIYFLDKDIDEARPYEFEYENKTETDIAIRCPTSPALYVRLGNSKNQVELVLHKSGIDLYEFEEDEYEPRKVSLASENEDPTITSDSFRKLNLKDGLKLCTLARRRHVLSSFVVDEEVTEAKVYAFQYDEQQGKQYNLAILCSATPTLYLQLVGRNKIKFTSITPRSMFHISGINVVGMVSRKMTKNRTEEDQSNLQKHSFITQLDAKARWDLCYIAQKYILDAGSQWNFRFTQLEKELQPFKLLLTPNCISDPDVYQIFIRNGVGKHVDDIVYRCTRWPEMFIRRAIPDNEIEILLVWEEVISLNE